MSTLLVIEFFSTCTYEYMSVCSFSMWNHNFSCFSEAKIYNFALFVFGLKLCTDGMA